MRQAGRYRVVRRIGEGGMAEVFEGEALGEGGFRRRVAIKRLLAANARDEDFRRMFLEEARIASQLHHAGIVSIVDFGISDGVPFQVLEYVDGVSCARLRELAPELPVEVALAIGTEIAHALDHAHHATDAEGRRLGIVHRDVSPGNILVSWSGDVKLTDFGIAFARGRVVTTSVGVAKGTLAFMAPEQVLRGEMDGRTDVFGLGCVLALLVSGESPLSTEGAMADLVAGSELKLSPTLPEDIRAIIARAVRLARRDRWESAAKLAAALGTALARRVAQDGKTLLREWMAPLRAPAVGDPERSDERRGRLDAALDLELVLAGTANEVREFRLRPSMEMRAVDPSVLGAAVDGAGGGSVVDGERTRRPTVRLERPVVAEAPVAAPVVEEPIAPPVAAWRAPVLAGLAALPALLALALAVTEHPMGPLELPAAAPPPDAAVVVVAPVPDAAPPRAPEDAVLVDEGATTAGGPTTLRAPRPDVPVPRPVPDENVPPTVTLGTLVIGGQGALKTEIIVDGKSRGFAPRTLELRLGEHDVELRGPDGQRRAFRRITLEARNTASEPLRWTVP